MINTTNGMISSSSAPGNAQSPGLKTYFKTPEGRYKLQYEKTHPSGLLHYAHGKTVTQVTLANLKDKPAPSTPTAPPSSFIASSGVRSAAARLLGASNGSRALSIVGGNGGSKSVSGSSRIGSLGSSSSSMINPNFDGKGTYLVFNVGDTIFISDLNSQDKDPIKSIHFSNSNPVCHAFDQDAKDGHDLLIGLSSGDGYLRVFDYSREQLVCGGKSYYGALLCCAWSMDRKYILTGGEDDLVQVWSMEDRKVVAWGEGHNSWVSGVTFDSYWSSPTSDGTGETVMYRFGSVGQDTQLLLWDLEMDEIVVPLRRCPPGGSPTFSTGSQSSHWENAVPVGIKLLLMMALRAGGRGPPLQLMVKQLLDYSAKALYVGEGSASAVYALRELGFTNACGAHRHPFFSLKHKKFAYELQYTDSSFDFVFSRDLDDVSVPAVLVLEIERVLKPGGIGAMLVGVIGLNANGLIRPFMEHLEPLVEKEEMRFEKKISFLPNFIDVLSRKKLVYIEIGAAEHLNSSVANWFIPSYPVEHKDFDIYFVDHNTSVLLSCVKKPGVTFIYDPGLAGDEISSLISDIEDPDPSVEDEGFDFLSWFRETAEYADFVVLKMKAGETELKFLTDLYESGAICFVDELFLSCADHVDDNDVVSKDCMDLLKSLRSSGMYVHQWWGD
ncbi:hypothetical protein GH714_028038 [Hevea brasiliensis]|uniref:Uncharacterized protein n=1 Tax=Hevea brasiliensis TaxID=3981 RepID=A0A6A6MJ02_HEVBR|nr:hypothetical protein GH714_028038 [Hevea brasiliensis]